MAMTFDAPQPGMDSDGDGDAAQDLWDEANAGTWTPQCWHESPQQMVDEARAQLWAGDAHVRANSNRHSQPPAPPSWMRDT